MHLLIRADASSQIGTGHVMRCLALAEASMQASQSHVTFLMATSVPSAIEARLQSEGIGIIYQLAPPGSQADADKTIANAHLLNADWLIVDGYHFGSSYQQSIKAAGLKLLLLDDYGHASHYWADIVLNQNVCAEEALYASRAPYTQLLLGSRYALLREEFRHWHGWQRQTSDLARKVLITLGGADLANVTLTVIQALEQLDAGVLDVIAVLGGSNPHYESLKAAVAHIDKNIELRRNVMDMPSLMAWADVAISAGGSTCWESAFMGLPSLVIVAAENQNPTSVALDDLGIATNLGWFEQLSSTTIAQALDELLQNTTLRKTQSSCAQKLVDGKGAERVLMHFQDPCLRLAVASESNCEMLWQWANEEDVRASSFSHEFIPWETHQEWFHAKLNSPNCQFYIALDQWDRPVGSIRYDIEAQEATVSIAIARQYRGQGYGASLIELSSTKIFRTLNVLQINAYIRPENRASLGAFQKAGFQELGLVSSVEHKTETALRLVKKHTNTTG